MCDTPAGTALHPQLSHQKCGHLVPMCATASPSLRGSSVPALGSPQWVRGLKGEAEIGVTQGCRPGSPSLPYCLKDPCRASLFLPRNSPQFPANTMMRPKPTSPPQLLLQVTAVTQGLGESWQLWGSPVPHLGTWYCQGVLCRQSSLSFCFSGLELPLMFFGVVTCLPGKMCPSRGS